MAMTTKKPPTETFRKVVEACDGNLSEIANRFNCSRRTVYNWCNDDLKFKQAIEDSRERFVDLAESTLHKLIAGVPRIEKDEQGNSVFAGWEVRPSETAIIFLLKTRGKKRGYVERSEVEADVSMKGSINIRDWVKDRLQKTAKD